MEKEIKKQLKSFVVEEMNKVAETEEADLNKTLPLPFLVEVIEELESELGTLQKERLTTLAREARIDILSRVIAKLRNLCEVAA